MEEWQEKSAYIQDYLEQIKNRDTQTVNTETSDSGMARLSGASFEPGIEERNGKIFPIWIKIVKPCILRPNTGVK